MAWVLVFCPESRCTSSISSSGIFSVARIVCTSIVCLYCMQAEAYRQYEFTVLLPVHKAGRIAGAEAVVDIYDGYSGCAGVEHPEECRDTAEGGPVADRGRHGDNRTADQP